MAVPKGFDKIGEKLVNEFRLARLTLWFLFGLGSLGMAATAWLVHEKADGASIAVLSGATGTAIGGLCGFLKPTREAENSPNQIK
jgi:hypothetical protein